MGKPKVPNTISDKQMAKLRWQGRNQPDVKRMFSKRAVEKRVASQKQRSKSMWS